MRIFDIDAIVTKVYFYLSLNSNKRLRGRNWKR